jgi:Tfp pilus assembly protein PilO
MAIKNQKNNQSTLTIVAVILLVVAVVGIFLFVLPQKDQLEQIQANLATEQTELNKLSAEIVKFNNLEDSFTGGEVTKKDVLNLIPENIEQDEVIDTFADLTDEFGLSFNSISFSAAAGINEDASVLNITTNVTGKHQNLIDFLEALETNSRKYRVKTLSVQTLENRLENMSLNIEAYFL